MLEWLKTILGDKYTEDIDKKVSEEIGKGFVARADFNAVKTELNTAKETIKARDNQLTTLQQSTGDVDALKKQITDLQAENATKEQEHAAEIARLKLDAAVDKALGEAHAKNTTAAKALLATFLKDAKVEEDGTVRGLADEIKKLAGDQATSFMFDSESNPTDKGGMAGAAPAGGTGTTPDPKVSGYESRLADARKAGNSALAVQIKREAAAEGINLY